ncbi:MAG: hypothetical protein IT385_20410 [Deltaproteobacteria bacterium]|nr:hypothetical protein [Deltaproteobacteria bacterium]
MPRTDASTRRAPRRGFQALVEDELRATNRLGGYRGSIVCTEQGLLVASAGDVRSDEALAGFASLFDAIVVRAGRDLELHAVDEVTLLDARAGRLVIRPLPVGRAAADEPPVAEPTAGASEPLPRLFLVLWMRADATWRRNTTRLVASLVVHFEARASAEAARDA